MNAALDSPSEREVILEEGTIRYRERGSGEPIVFIHGLLVNGLLWRKVVTELEDGFRCIAPDWPLGAHGVAMNPQADLSPPGMARLIAHFIARLELDRPTVVGNDTGGAFAQLLAANHPERVGRLVLTNADAFARFLPPAFRYLQWLSRVPGSSWLLAQGARVPAVRRLPLAYGSLTKRPMDPAVLAEYSARLLADPRVRRDLRKVLRGISARYTLAAAERLRAFDRPALLAWASEDRVFPMALAERLLELLPRATLEPIADSYAFVPEDQPIRLAQLIRDFVSEGQPRLTAA
ncbi:MAG: alpha/beta hydrolase [Actinomycetota bacterium]|nr:alpha/beta hydrolase [Actinomycetota bacterium]